eukprot:18332-Prorocentrum_minimum.AAC.1
MPLKHDIIKHFYTSEVVTGPIRCMKRGYIPTTDQSDAGGAGIFPRRTNQMQEVRVYSHDGPIRCRKCGYIPMTDQSDGVPREGQTRPPPLLAASWRHARAAWGAPTEAPAHENTFSSMKSECQTGSEVKSEVLTEQNATVETPTANQPYCSRCGSNEHDTGTCNAKYNNGATNVLPYIRGSIIIFCVTGAGIMSVTAATRTVRRTNHMQEAWVYSHGGPIKRRPTNLAPLEVIFFVQAVNFSRDSQNRLRAKQTLIGVVAK